MPASISIRPRSRSPDLARIHESGDFKWAFPAKQAATAEQVQWEQYIADDGHCSFVLPGKVEMRQGLRQEGDHTVTIAIPYIVGVGKGTVAKGSIRYGATIWSDLATRQLFKTFELPDYCYAFD